jgi:UDP-N-acetylmuramate dehydrogenase
VNDNAALVARLQGILTLRRNEPLAKHTSFRIGGPADFYAQARSREQLLAAVQAAWETGTPTLLLGGGSNLLVLDGGVRGVVIETRARRVVGLPAAPLPPGEVVEIVAEAGAPLAALARRTAALGLAGLEWAVDLPGTVGGAVVNNAGAHGGEMAGVLVAVELLEPEGAVNWWPTAALGLAYRTSRLKVAPLGQPRPVVLAAKIRLQAADPLSLRAALARYSQYRRATQPVGACAGSMFKNPPDQAAGWYIEQAGMKGARVGAVQVSEIHGNFMLNLGGARATDVLRLVERVQEAVWRRFGVSLELEIQVVGEVA